MRQSKWFFKTLAPAQTALAEVTGREEDDDDDAVLCTHSLHSMRIWSLEYRPYVDSVSGNVIKGKRGYAVCTAAKLYQEICDTRESDRNWYEVVYGACHLYADYDLPLPSKHSALAAHAEFTRCLQHVLKGKVTSFSEHRLTGTTARKDSMHVRWEMRDAEDHVVVFRSPTECRRVVSAALRYSIETGGSSGQNLGIDHPLFRPAKSSAKPEKDVVTCILDMGVYNPNRNFRLAGNVKPQINAADCAGWLVPFGTPADAVRHMVPVDVFSQNLICFVPSGAHFIDTSDIPDLLDNVRRVLDGTAPDSDATRYLSAAAAAFASSSSSSASISSFFPAAPGPAVSGANPAVAARDPRAAAPSTQRQLETQALAIVRSVLAAADYKVTMRSSGFFVVRMVTTMCAIKGDHHKSNYDTSCYVHLGYPRPRLYLHCFKDACKAKLEARTVCNEVLLSGDTVDELLAEYTRLCDAMLSGAVVANNRDFF